MPPPKRNTAMKLPTILLLFTAAWAAAQPRPSAVPDGAYANLPAQRIGPSDLVVVQVYDAPELSRSVRVGADGYVRLPMLKRRVKAEGLMPAELELAVAEAIRGEQLILDPFVTISIGEYASRPISVAGAVKAPLTFQASGPVTLLEAVTRAGGLTAEAGSEILVSKTQPGPGGAPTSLVQRIPVKSLIDAADPEANLKLTGGEEIRVPETGRIFVVGNVKRPGSFPIHDGDDTTILKMLALAEGLMPYAGKEAFIYRREGGTGSKNEIPVPLQKIMERKAPDAPLVANDVLYVPDNHGRRLGIAALEKILMFGSTAGATALVYGRIR
jgi:polysaccharide biosynthesis/export protein